MRIDLHSVYARPERRSERLYVSVADTPSKHQRGLMFVKDMPENKGMFFVFSHQQNLKFWGENTFIPLDIAFADKQGVIKKVDRISPFSRAAVSSDLPCLYAIEANDGFFKHNNIGVGDKIFLNSDADGSCYLDFIKKRRNTGNSNETLIQRTKMSQAMPAEQGEQPAETAPVDNQSLPVLDISNLGDILEDDLEKPADEIAPPAPEEQPEPEQQPEYEYPQFSNVFDAVNWAEQNNEVMRITYTTQHGTQLARDIEPHGSFHAKTTNRQILVTFDETVGDIRAFIMTNIGAFSFVGKRFDKKFRIA